MGRNVAVAFANIFMSRIETADLTILKPSLLPGKTVD